MAKTVVAAWAACVKDLQHFVAAASASTPATGSIATPAASKEFDSFLQCLEKIRKQPSLPHAAWKKLVADVQVMCWHGAPSAGVTQTGAPMCWGDLTYCGLAGAYFQEPVQQVNSLGLLNTIDSYTHHIWMLGHP
jgi:hypothetical protein